MRDVARAREYNRDVAQCPQCQHKVPYSAMLRAGGLAGIVCPRCNTELEPVMWRQLTALAVAMVISMAAASGVGFVGLANGWRGPVQLVTFVVLSMLAWVTVFRLQRRGDRSRPLGLH